MGTDLTIAADADSAPDNGLSANARAFPDLGLRTDDNAWSETNAGRQSRSGMNGSSLRAKVKLMLGIKSFGDGAKRAPDRSRRQQCCPSGNSFWDYRFIDQTPARLRGGEIQFSPGRVEEGEMRRSCLRQCGDVENQRIAICIKRAIKPGAGAQFRQGKRPAIVVEPRIRHRNVPLRPRLILQPVQWPDAAEPRAQQRQEPPEQRLRQEPERGRPPELEPRQGPGPSRP